MRTTFIYAIVDDHFDAVHYVGKSDTPEIRFQSHRNLARHPKHNPQFYKWLRTTTCRIRILEEVPIDNWRERERFGSQNSRRHSYSTSRLAASALARLEDRPSTFLDSGSDAWSPPKEFPVPAACTGAVFATAEERLYRQLLICGWADRVPADA